MDRFTRAFYELKFEVAFLTRSGNAFQDFFGDIMEKCHPGDFQRVRPWGRVGDRKNDGYLWSRRTLFQVYAPNDMTAAEAITKIDQDYHGALPYWEQYFDYWTFVHNARRGLAPDVLRKLLDLNDHHPSVTVAGWGFEELRQNVFTLDLADLASLLGEAPSQRDMLELRFEDLQEVLRAVAAQEPPADPEIRPVPPGKLLRNGLSGSTQVLLEAGMRKAALVEAFFNQHPEPTFGDQIAQALKRKYERLQGLRMDPDVIFHELQTFAGGSQRGQSRYEAAVLAVLAFFFEACDIFERPLEEVAP